MPPDIDAATEETFANLRPMFRIMGRIFTMLADALDSALPALVSQSAPALDVTPATEPLSAPETPAAPTDGPTAQSEPQAPTEAPPGAMLGG